jgi:hypothetical protein
MVIREILVIPYSSREHNNFQSFESLLLKMYRLFLLEVKIEPSLNQQISSLLFKVVVMVLVL